MNNIVLIGFMGCGKTTVGTTLAEKLQFSLLDTDAYIEKREHKTISQIFDEDGEEYFRNVETDSLRELIRDTADTVISSGGGLPLREVNANLLKELGTVIYLTAKPDTIYDRVKDSTTRPLLQVEDPKQRIVELLEYRRPLYESASHYKVATDDKTVDEIVDEIIKIHQVHNLK